MTAPTIAQSLAQSAPHIRNHTTTFPTFPPKKPRKYRKPVFFSPVTPSSITTSKIYYSLIEPQLLHSIPPCGNKFHIFCTTDSMKSWAGPAPSFPRITQTFPECLRRLSQMLGVIPQSMWQHSPKYLRTFPRMFHNILRNV